VNPKKPWPSQDEIAAVSVNVACGSLGIGRSLLYRLMRDERLVTVKLGRRRLVPIASLRRLLDHK